MGNYVLQSQISVSSLVGAARKSGFAVVHLFVQTCLHAAPETMQRRCLKSKWKHATVNMLLLCKHKGQRLQRCQTCGCFSAATDVLAKATCSLPYGFLLERWLISSWNCSDIKWWLPEKASFVNCGWVIEEGRRSGFSPMERRLLQFSFVLD